MFDECKREDGLRQGENGLWGFRSGPRAKEHICGEAVPPGHSDFVLLYNEIGYSIGVVQHPLTRGGYPERQEGRLPFAPAILAGNSGRFLRGLTIEERGTIEMKPSETKANRLLQIETLLCAHPEGLTQAEIVRRLGMARARILYK